LILFFAYIICAIRQESKEKLAFSQAWIGMPL
jgi:hypothetical protein